MLEVTKVRDADLSVKDFSDEPFMDLVGVDRSVPARLSNGL